MCGNPADVVQARVSVHVEGHRLPRTVLGLLVRGQPLLCENRIRLREVLTEIVQHLRVALGDVEQDPHVHGQPHETMVSAEAAG